MNARIKLKSDIHFDINNLNKIVKITDSGPKEILDLKAFTFYSGYTYSFQGNETLLVSGNEIQCNFFSN